MTFGYFEKDLYICHSVMVVHGIHHNILSFLNGVIAGAAAVLAIMSSAFLILFAPLEFSKALTTTELRVAIFLGAIVFVIAIAYEFYLTNITKKRKSDERAKKDGNMIKDGTKNQG